MDPKMSPSNCDLVAYTMNNDIWVKHIVSGDERRLTFANTGAFCVVFSSMLIIIWCQAFEKLVGLLLF